MSIRVTPAEAVKLLKEAGSPKRNKYGVRLTEEGRAARTYKDILYDSLAEAKYAMTLDLRLKLGEIAEWWRQIRFPLVVNTVLVGTMKIDFKLLYHDRSIEFVEVKGVETEAYRLRVKLFRALYPTTKLTVIKSRGIK